MAFDNDTTDASQGWTWKKPSTTGVGVLSFTCKVPVTVSLPYYGCVYCPECAQGSGYGEASASEFKYVISGLVEEDLWKPYINTSAFRR